MATITNSLDGPISDVGIIQPIIVTMAGMINYLTVSLYQGQFTYNHEQAWARLNDIYDSISKTPSVLPLLSHVIEFYSNVVFLWRVTESEDLDYHIYMRQFRRHIAGYQTTVEGGVAETDPADGPAPDDGPADGPASVTTTAIQKVEDGRQHIEEDDAMCEEEQAWYDRETSSLEQQEWDDTDWLAKEREDWTESIRFKNRNWFYAPH